MNKNRRAATFARYVGLELKGQIRAREFTAAQVVEVRGGSEGAMSRWLNGKVNIPLEVVCDVCEIIGIEPASVIQYAYDRMVQELGEP